MTQRFGEIVVSVEKLSDYCLSETHPRGRHKARVFKTRLGLGSEDADWLMQALIEAATSRQEEMAQG